MASDPAAARAAVDTGGKVSSGTGPPSRVGAEGGGGAARGGDGDGAPAGSAADVDTPLPGDGAAAPQVASIDSPARRPDKFPARSTGRAGERGESAFSAASASSARAPAAAGAAYDLDLLPHDLISFVRWATRGDDRFSGQARQPCARDGVALHSFVGRPQLEIIAGRLACCCTALRQWAASYRLHVVVHFEQREAALCISLAPRLRLSYMRAALSRAYRVAVPRAPAAPASNDAAAAAPSTDAAGAGAAVELVDYGGVLAAATGEAAPFAAAAACVRAFWPAGAASALMAGDSNDSGTRRSGEGGPPACLDLRELAGKLDAQSPGAAATNLDKVLLAIRTARALISAQTADPSGSPHSSPSARAGSGDARGSGSAGARAARRRAMAAAYRVVRVFELLYARRDDMDGDLLVVDFTHIWRESLVAAAGLCSVGDDERARQCRPMALPMRDWLLYYAPTAPLHENCEQYPVRALEGSELGRARESPSSRTVHFRLVSQLRRRLMVSPAASPAELEAAYLRIVCGVSERPAAEASKHATNGAGSSKEACVPAPVVADAGGAGASEAPAAAAAGAAAAGDAAATAAGAAAAAEAPTPETSATQAAGTPSATPVGEESSGAGGAGGGSGSSAATPSAVAAAHPSPAAATNGEYYMVPQDVPTRTAAAFAYHVLKSPDLAAAHDRLEDLKPLLRAFTATFNPDKPLQFFGLEKRARPTGVAQVAPSASSETPGRASEKSGAEAAAPAAEAAGAGDGARAKDDAPAAEAAARTPVVTPTPTGDRSDARAGTTGQARDSRPDPAAVAAARLAVAGI